MKIVFSRHAINRNRKIRATDFEITDCLEKPDSYYMQNDGREIAIKAVGNKLLKVVYLKSSSVYKIITLIDRNQ